MNDILQNTLAEILKQISNFFGVTTEVIMQNAPKWFAKYGWYCAIDDFCIASIFCIPISAICAIFALFFLIEECDIDFSPSKKIFFITAFVLIAEFVVVGTTLIKCAVSPEMYGMVQIFNQVK